MLVHKIINTMISGENVFLILNILMNIVNQSHLDIIQINISSYLELKLVSSFLSHYLFLNVKYNTKISLCTKIKIRENVPDRKFFIHIHFLLKKLFL